jgi:hypothetical protein
MLETVARHWKDALLTVCSLLFRYDTLEHLHLKLVER